MNNLFKILLISIWFLLLSGTKLFAAHINEADTLILDKGQVEIYKKAITQSRIENYRQQSDFNYEYSEVENISLFDKIRLMINRWMAFLIKSLGVVWFLRYIILGGIIVLLIYIILKSNASGLFSPHQKIINIPFADDVNPENVNWEEEIEKAVKMGEYRLAIRYQFLSSLKSLSKNNFINWKAEKTNYDYINEIKDKQVKTDFNDLSNLYEAVWYGNFSIIHDEYALIGQDFEKFNSLFNTRNQ
ncbi:hypothetical protein [Marinifilum fragile]|uniref:hypothetical protein n=1 Tax=Marinifilum fragile TaxID=570161 RepID=UPI002AA7F6A6|nr:hypothetical protein [Marinifilum fragile]